MVKILCNNKAGLNSAAKLSAALRQARSYDIAMYQETKLKKSKLNEVRAKWGSPDVFMASCPGVNSRRGVLTLFSPSFQVQHLDTKADDQGQFLINIVALHTSIMMIINYYGDPDTDQSSLQTLQRLETAINVLRQQYQIDEKIIGGDFNYVLDDLDTTSGNRRPNTEAMWRAMEADLELYDPEVLFRQHPRRTYFRHHHEETQARYDRFYITRGLITGAELDELARTGDHKPLVLKIMEVEAGHKQWNMDDKLLDKVEGVEIIHRSVRTVLGEFVDDPDDEIDVSQIQYFIDFDNNCPLRILTRVITSLRAKLKEASKLSRMEAVRTEKQLIDDLINARDQHNVFNSPEALEDYEDARNKLHLYQSNRAARSAEGNFIRYARAGEKVTHYHFSLMNKGRQARIIRELQVPNEQDPNQTRTINNQEIVQYMSQKFGEIAREDPTVGNTTIREFLGDALADEAMKCPDYMKDQLEDYLSADELKEAIAKMKNVSCPGPLGLTNRLLKAIYPLLQEVLVKAGNRLLFSDIPHVKPQWLFHRKVVFIPKPGKSPTSEDSYRGLSMLENIFKAYSTILAQRMARVLKIVQDPEQYGFTEGKSCMEPTRSIIDTLRHANQNIQPLVILSTDLYKAFDTVSLCHIERCLDFFEFPEKYKKAFMTLARNGTLQFEINGQLSDDVVLNRGTGQGDPKSSFCFNM